MIVVTVFHIGSYGYSLALNTFIIKPNCADTVVLL